MSPEEAVRVYGSGTGHDEGGAYHMQTAHVPSWVKPARKHCRGCRNDFYNGRANCTGKSWCFMLKTKFARRKTRPPCYHGGGAT